MGRGWSTQVTRQIGEHLVVAELGRRLNLIGAPFAGNVPHFDLLAADKQGRSIPIQVKAINGPSWQFDIRDFLSVEVIDGVQHVRGKVQMPMPDLVCVFVLLHPAGDDEFYIFRMRDLQEHFAATYHGGRRRRNPESMHCAVWPAELQQHRDQWDVVCEALSSAPSVAGSHANASNHGPVERAHSSDRVADPERSDGRGE